MKSNNSFKLNLSESGLRKTLREYEEVALRYLWEVGYEGAVSGVACKAINERLVSSTISRTSVIVFFNKLVDQGVLGYKDATGKGGTRKIYYSLMDEKGYVKYLIKTMVESMMRDFPEETKEVLSVYAPG